MRALAASLHPLRRSADLPRPQFLAPGDPGGGKSGATIPDLGLHRPAGPAVGHRAHQAALRAARRSIVAYRRGLRVARQELRAGRAAMSRTAGEAATARAAFCRDADGLTEICDSQPAAIVPARLRAERLAIVRQAIAAADLAAVVLFDPNNQRYATGSRNMFGYFLRNSTRYVYVPQDGPTILFEYPGSAHVSTWLETIDEARTSKVVWSAVNARDCRAARPFAEEIASLVRKDGSGNRRVGLDRFAHNLALALQQAGLEVED